MTTNDTTKDLAHLDHDNIQECDEHGQRWAHCLTCGESWSVVECVDLNGNDYEDYEEIDGGDGWCAEHHE